MRPAARGFGDAGSCAAIAWGAVADATRIRGFCFPVGSTATVDVALRSLGAVETVPEVRAEVGTEDGVETDGAEAGEAGTGAAETGAVVTSAGAGAAAEGCGEGCGEDGAEAA